MGKSGEKIRRNIASGVLYQAVLVAVSFLLPRLYLENFGSEVNGVLSTIKQIFTYMTLFEAGVGLAATRALYKPIAEKNVNAVNSVLSAAKHCYLRTGVAYLAAVLVLAVVYSFAVPTGMPHGVVFTLIILNAIPTLFSYFIQAKYRILMEADGRRYVINHAETALQLASNAGKIVVLLLSDSLVLIQLVYCVLAVAQLSFLYIYAKRNYRWLDLGVKPDLAAISQRESVLVHQISAMVFNNTDIILLSFMCDFKTVSIYTIYNIFFSQMRRFVSDIIYGYGFALGQMFGTDRKRFDKCFEVYETLFVMCTFFVYTLMAVFLLPIVGMYTKGIDDADYINPLLMLLFALVSVLECAKLPVNQVIEYAGEFRETRSHAIVEMTVNITVSVAAVMKWGICGALFGTAAALAVRGVLAAYYANRFVLSRKMSETFKVWIVNLGVFAAVTFALGTDGFLGDSFGMFVLDGLKHAPWIAALYLAANFVLRKKVFSGFVSLLRERKDEK